jgi:hypothetical protein
MAFIIPINSMKEIVEKIGFPGSSTKDREILFDFCFFVMHDKDPAKNCFAVVGVFLGIRAQISRMSFHLIFFKCVPLPNMITTEVFCGHQE